MELFKKSLVAVVIVGTLVSGLEAVPRRRAPAAVAAQPGYVARTWDYVRGISPRRAAAAALTVVGGITARDCMVEGGDTAQNVELAVFSAAALTAAAVLTVPSLKDKVVAAVKATPGAVKAAALWAWSKVPSFRRAAAAPRRSARIAARRA